MLKTNDSRLPWVVSLQGKTDMKIKCIFLSFHDQQSLPNTKIHHSEFIRIHECDVFQLD